MRIAFVANPAAPGGWYRGIGPMEALQRRGHEVRALLGEVGDLHADGVRGCDALLVYREHAGPVLRLIKQAKERGIAVLWDNDDNLAAVPANNVAHKEYGGAAGARVQLGMSKVIRLADCVTAPCASLCDEYAARGAAQVRLVENYVRDDLPDLRSRGSRGEVRIGWLAGSEHHVDVERIPIRAALERLLETHPHVRVTSIGVGLGIADPRYRHVRGLPFSDLPAEMASFDVGIAPLADIPFNHGRSNVKLKEYAAQGIPWLASAVGPYAGLGERQGGRLVAADGWYEALSRIVVKARERRSLTKRAARWGRDQTIGANASAWEAALEAAAERVQLGTRRDR